MTREELIAMILSAQTREEVVATQQAIGDWMDVHPDDLGILYTGEMVEMLAETYGMTSPGQQERFRRQDILFERMESDPTLTREEADEEFRRISMIKEDGTEGDED